MRYLNWVWKLIRHPTKPFWILSEESRRRIVFRQINGDFHTRFDRREHNTEGIDIFDQDWDNLILLDAFRYDTFERIYTERASGGKLDSRISRGSQTPEWLRANFHDRQLHDVVYVSANPMPYVLGEQPPDENSERHRRYNFNLDVHDLIPVWNGSPPTDSEYRQDEEIVTPEQTIKAALQAEEKYPNKRLLIHFTQPHTPYLGSTGDELHSQSERPWYDWRDGNENISLGKLRRAYRENAEIAFDAGQKLSTALSGKTVVTSDHGELLWEKSFPIPFKDFLHPPRTYIKPLVKVPWLVRNAETRKEIRPENPKNTERDIIAEDAERNLEALGYK